MTDPDEELRERIVTANQLFEEGEFAACYEAAHALLDQLTAEVIRYEAWRAQLFGLIGKSALQLSLSDEALAATREALHRVEALNDDALYPLLEGYRENLLTVLAAREPPEDLDDPSLPLSHRTIRRDIIRAQSLTDRFRFVRSIDVLEPLRDGLTPLTGGIGTSSSAEPDDVRVCYLPRVLGLLGLNWFLRGEPAQATDLTAAALELSRRLGDLTGVRVYQTNLTQMGRADARNGAPFGVSGAPEE
ncbi:hypothetical protein [Pedococcus sp. 5OH_020]|uniref:hypothetical protein n=1 Tax=Pedococcus sp. 5OH_020 TaxID=2989814 RepID=UPI0022E9EBEA|nr:hypothetical protein [Pedococcus sp. 5OH_020]